MERRQFTREFKLEAVRLIKQRGVSYAQASKDLGVHPTQLRNWVKLICKGETALIRMLHQQVVSGCLDDAAR
jgi:transposase-like protein